MTNKLLSALLALVLFTLGVLMTLFSTPPPTNAQNTLQWEYLTVNYIQYRIASPSTDTYGWYEVLITGDPNYDLELQQIWFGDCDPVFLGMALDGFTEDPCILSNFQGRNFYLNKLGENGWELFMTENLSTEYRFETELLFKRPKQ